MFELFIYGAVIAVAVSMVAKFAAFIFDAITDLQTRRIIARTARLRSEAERRESRP